MHRVASTLRRALWLTCLCVVLVAPRADADAPALTADFDGDGHGDRVTFTSEESSVVRVWLSATRTTNVIRSSEPFLAVASADLDGDRRAELLASNRSSGLQIWTKKPKGFRAFRPKHRGSPIGFSRSNHRALDPGSTPPALTTAVFRSVPSALALSVHPSTTTFRTWRHAPRLARGPTSSPSLAPFAPRAPPLSTI